MISILLILLKIIGIALLVVIGLLLLLVLIVLFVPVRYRIKGRYEDSLYLTGRITWLLHLLSIRVEVGDGTVTSIRILGIPLSKFIKDRKDSKSVAESEIQKEPESVSEAEMEKVPEPVAETQIQKDTESVSESEKQEDPGTVADTEKQKDSKPVSLYQKIKSKILSVLDKIRGILEKIKHFWHNAVYRKKQLQRFIRILRSDTCKAAFSLCKKRFGKVLRHIFPGKVHADLTFGFDDPSTTGYLLAVYGMLPGYVGKHILLHPDFDNSVLKGNFNVKGRVRAWTLLYQALCVFFDKNCRKLYHIVKKESGYEHK